MFESWCCKNLRFINLISPYRLCWLVSKCTRNLKLPYNFALHQTGKLESCIYSYIKQNKYIAKYEYVIDIQTKTILMMFSININHEDYIKEKQKSFIDIYNSYLSLNKNKKIKIDFHLSIILMNSSYTTEINISALQAFIISKGFKNCECKSDKIEDRLSLYFKFTYNNLLQI